jgi:hypothetical protein
MEAWRQWLLGGRKSLSQKRNRAHLTPTGLLMEGVFTTLLVAVEMAISRHVSSDAFA